MANAPGLFTEEDIRSKIVVPWLKARGVDFDQILLEFSFAVQLGRSVVTVANGTTKRAMVKSSAESQPEHTTYTARADVLVRNSQGENLLIIEAKAPGVVLTDEASNQAISYARLLEGNIAPYAVVTNGAQTNIFDSFTRERINDENIDLVQLSHRIKFYSTEGQSKIKAEALDVLLSSSPVNLLHLTFITGGSAIT